MKKDIKRLIESLGLEVMIEAGNDITIDFGTTVTVEGENINLVIDNEAYENISPKELFDKLVEAYI